MVKNKLIQIFKNIFMSWQQYFLSLSISISYVQHKVHSAADMTTRAHLCKFQGTSTGSNNIIAKHYIATYENEMKVQWFESNMTKKHQKALRMQLLFLIL
jgi:hypothetical protein